MQTENRYQFEKSPKRKGTCPACKHKNEFRFMYDTHTGERLPENFGRCERSNNCGYALYPTKENYTQHYCNKNNFNHSFNKPIMNHNTSNFNQTSPEINEIKFIDTNVVSRSKQAFYANNFVIWLQSLFDSETVNNLLKTYHVGTAKGNKTLFWYCDIENRYRTGKIIAYPNVLYPTEIHRIKVIKPYYIHTKLPKNENEKYEFCNFGEHLVNRPENIHKTVAIVESEKSAIIASVYMPDFVWIASGGADMLKEVNMQVLKKRKIILVPDFDKKGREAFAKRANEYKSKGYNIAIFDIAPEIDDGTDIADFLTTEKPIIKQVASEIEKQIINHYQSYKLPYDYTETNDLQSLVRGYKAEYQMNISNEIYFETLQKFEIPTVKHRTGDYDRNVWKYFVGFETYFEKVRAGQHPIESVYNVFKQLFDTDLSVEQFQNELTKISVENLILPDCNEPMPY